MESRRRPDCQLFHRGVQGNRKRVGGGYWKIEKRLENRKNQKKNKFWQGTVTCWKER